MTLEIPPQIVHASNVLAVLDGKAQLFELFLELPAVKLDVLADPSTPNARTVLPQVRLQARLIQIQKDPKVNVIRFQ
jgi:hypothetical protein